ncbi:hypothetical protein ILUMI_19212 [Ignelater luminosus]|uniref:Uncharacterized protein n=1 Tax=Ignelater luminosus TaxID=2038154 RepID=A0A8K0CKZ3_IGNLU|nr:hypothetical protein ILUMI_19212 [Ignelater luminosus]
MPRPKIENSETGKTSAENTRKAIYAVMKGELSKKSSCLKIWRSPTDPKLYQSTRLHHELNPKGERKLAFDLAIDNKCTCILERKQVSWEILVYWIHETEYRTIIKMSRVNYVKSGSRPPGVGTWGVSLEVGEENLKRCLRVQYRENEKL